MRELPREGLPFDPAMLALHELLALTKPDGVSIGEPRPSPVHLRLVVTVEHAIRSDGRRLDYIVDAADGVLVAYDPEWDREDDFRCELADPEVVDKFWRFVLARPANRQLTRFIAYQ